MPALPTVTIKPICDVGWTQWGTSCYKLETTVVSICRKNHRIINYFPKKSWDAAHTICVCTHSAELVDIKSKAEDGFIQALTGGTEAIWTGRKGDSLYLMMITFHNLAGATDDTMEELWTWSAGGNIQYLVCFIPTLLYI